MGIYDQFLAKVHELLDKGDESSLSDVALIVLAKEMGLSQENWEYIEQKFNEYILRAENHLKHKNYSHAINELTNALLIKPLNENALLLMSKAYLLVWKQNKEELNYNHTLYYAEKVIRLYPDSQEAYRLIQQTKRKSLFEFKFVYIVVAIVIIVSLMLFARSFYYQSVDDIVAEIVQETEIVHEPEMSTHQYFIQNERLSIESNQFNASLFSFELDDAEIQDFGESFSLRFKADLKVGDFELKELTIGVEVYSPMDSLLKTDELKIISYQPKARPDDVLALRYLYYDSSSVELPLRVVLSIRRIKKSPRAEHYAKSKLIEIENASEFENFSFVVRQRSSRFDESEIMKQTTHKLSLEIVNTGTNYIEKMRFKVMWYNTDSKLLSEKSIWVNISDDPAIKPEQRRVVSTIQSFKYRKISELILYKVELEQIE